MKTFLIRLSEGQVRLLAAALDVINKSRMPILNDIERDEALMLADHARP